MLIARRIALQGFGAPFPLSPLALAVQGLIGGELVDTPVAERPRAAIVGCGPGTTINLSDYLTQLKRSRTLPKAAVHTSAHPDRKRAKQRRQRQLASVALQALI